MDKGCRTAAEAFVIAGTSIIILQGSGSNMLHVAAPSQKWFKARLQYILQYGGSLAMTWGSGVYQSQSTLRTIHVKQD